MTNRAPSLQPGGWIWFQLFMIQLQPIDNYSMAIKKTTGSLNPAPNRAVKCSQKKPTTNSDCALLWAAETQRERCVPPPSCKAGAKVEPRQEVVVWGACTTVTVSVFVFLALGKERENKDGEMKAALGRLCPELQWMQCVDEWSPQQIHFLMVLIWPADDGFSWVLLWFFRDPFISQN